MKCSFCEQQLVCKFCRQPFQPRTSEGHLGAYRSDMEVHCPECQKVLTCIVCGYVYGADEEDEDDTGA